VQRSYLEIVVSAAGAFAFVRRFCLNLYCWEVQASAALARWIAVTRGDKTVRVALLQRTYVAAATYLPRPAQPSPGSWCRLPPCVVSPPFSLAMITALIDERAAVGHQSYRGYIHRNGTVWELGEGDTS
jgi:hypothetical protein